MYVFIKNLILSFVFPLPSCILILLVGLYLLLSKKRQRAGKIIIVMGVFLLLLFSLPFLPNLLLKSIERQYPMFKILENKKDTFADINYIVVLAGGSIVDSDIPITSQFANAGLVRLIEGIKLYRELQGTKLIFSGGAGSNPISNAKLMADLSISLGVPKSDIILETKSTSTFDEARLIKPIVKSERFLLVTSASHMFRSIALFNKMGMNPIPAPTGHLVKHYRDGISFVPDSLNIFKSKIIFYEFLGLVKEKLFGNI